MSVPEFLGAGICFCCHNAPYSSTTGLGQCLLMCVLNDVSDRQPKVGLQRVFLIPFKFPKCHPVMI